MANEPGSFFIIPLVLITALFCIYLGLTGFFDIIFDSGVGLLARIILGSVMLSFVYLGYLFIYGLTKIQ